MTWSANYAGVTELTRDFINLVLEKVMEVLKLTPQKNNPAKHQLQYEKSFGFFGTLEAELLSLSVPDLEDPGAPGGGVLTDLEAKGKYQFCLFKFIPIRSEIRFLLEDVSIDFVTTNAGLPRAIVVEISSSLRAEVTFPGAFFLFRWFLNGIVGRLIAFGVWLAFRIIRKVEIPIWQLLDIFAAIGLRFADKSPLLTAQKTTVPHSLLVASNFNLTNPLVGLPNQLKSFIPARTNIGAVMHEKVVAAGVQVAFSKGWVPHRFRVGKWKIYINRIAVRFEKDKIRATGSLKAKRGKCWCRVKARIRYDIQLEPKVVMTPGPNPTPTAVFNYDADINTQISTSGMLVVMGAIMLAPLFMGLTIAFSTLINLVLDKFLPFRCDFPINGGFLNVTIRSVGFSGLLPFYVRFPLQLSGQGTYDLTPYQQFELDKDGKVKVDVEFTEETIALEPQELRVAVGLS